MREGLGGKGGDGLRAAGCGRGSPSLYGSARMDRYLLAAAVCRVLCCPSGTGDKPSKPRATAKDASSALRDEALEAAMTHTRGLADRIK